MKSPAQLNNQSGRFFRLVVYLNWDHSKPWGSPGFLCIHLFLRALFSFYSRSLWGWGFLVQSVWVRKPRIAIYDSVWTQLAPNDHSILGGGGFPQSSGRNFNCPVLLCDMVSKWTATGRIIKKNYKRQKMKASPLCLTMCFLSETGIHRYAYLFTERWTTKWPVEGHSSRLSPKITVSSS